MMSSTGIEQDPVIGLTRDLVRIPSYVDESTNEIAVAEFVAQYLEEQVGLPVVRQQVADGRFNVLAGNTVDPKLILLGHLDTVQPSAGTDYEVFAGEMKDGKIFDLGACDMKSGVAALLDALRQAKSMGQALGEILIVLYIDEEYHFAGMKKLIEEYKEWHPDLIFSADGGDLQLGHGCRGLIEVAGYIFGKSAHAGSPHRGVNAIEKTSAISQKLAQRLKDDWLHPVLGQPSVNLAAVNGGKNRGTKPNGEIEIGVQANSVPDVTRFLFDIRPTNPELNATVIRALLEELCQEEGVRLEGFDVHHDKTAWYTDPSELEMVHGIVEEGVGSVTYRNPAEGGYVDLQMLWDVVGRPPAVALGAGPFAVAHTNQEYVEVEAVVTLRDMVLQLILNWK